MNTLGWIITVIVCIYIAVCFGKIAGKYGKNPILFGILSIISPINLIILGYWAFSDYESQKKSWVFAREEKSGVLISEYNINIWEEVSKCH